MQTRLFTNLLYNSYAKTEPQKRKALFQCSFHELIFSTNFSRLSKNPYYCDCRMVWFLRDGADMKKHILDLEEMRCEYPEKMRGQKIVEMKERDICSTGIVLKKAIYFIKCFAGISSTDKTDNFTCKIIYDNFTCTNYRFFKQSLNIASGYLKLAEKYMGGWKYQIYFSC